MKKIVWEKFKDPLKDVIEEEDGDLKELPGKALITPQGILPLSEETLLSNKYNLWIAHVNFDITQALAESLEEIPGVEALDIFSRYRFRIAIGKLFEENETKILVEGLMGCLSNNVEVLDKETKKNVKNLIETLIDKNYVIYVLPNGKIISYVNDKIENLMEKIEFFESVQEKVGGQLLINKMEELKNLQNE